MVSKLITANFLECALYNFQLFMQFVETELASKMDPKFIDLMGGFMPMEMVVKGKNFPN